MSAPRQLHSCAKLINWLPSPPTPQTEWLRACRGKLGRKGVWAIDFLKWVSESFFEAFQIDGGCCCFYIESVAAVTSPPDLVPAINPPKRLKIPPNQQFFHNPFFLRLRSTLSLSLFIFKKREREERAGKNSEKTGFEHPQLGSIHQHVVLYYFLLYVEKVLKKQACCGCTIEDSCGLQPESCLIEGWRREMPMYPRHGLAGGLDHE